MMVVVPPTRLYYLSVAIRSKQEPVEKSCVSSQWQSAQSNEHGQSNSPINFPAQIRRRAEAEGRPGTAKEKISRTKLFWR
jgi:hypothetical protein